MMPILDLQKQAAQAGRIRIGQQVATGGTHPDGRPKMRPAKLGTFRLTTSSRHAADRIAEVLGGAVVAWENAPTAGQWEVITEQSQIPVVIPPGDPEHTVSQWNELWSGGGCVRRCDGVTERLTQQPCMCPRDGQERAQLAARGRACRATTRINVLIPDLPGLGVWMLETHGWYAARELGGTAEILARSAEQGLMLPALLRIDQRVVRRGGQTKQFPVPVLEVMATIRELAAAMASGEGLALPPGPQELRAIEAGVPVPPRPAPVPAPGGVSPAQQVADAADKFSGPADLPKLRELWDRASTDRLLDEAVLPPGDDAYEPLRTWLEAVGNELAAADSARPTDQETRTP